MTQTRQWLLNGHPRGRPIVDDDLKLVTTDLPAPGPGEMLMKTHYLAFDPAQKGWMENIANYVAPMAIGDVMRGSAILEVVESNDGKHAVGTMLAGTSIWSEYWVDDGAQLNLCEPSLPPTAMLSILGTTGMTAYCGLFKIGKPVAGDIVLVSGAAGATGSVVGQLAKIAGCKVRINATGWSMKQAMTTRLIIRREACVIR
jgi:NADPH-dependent curcumin reductase CurA